MTIPLIVSVDTEEDSWGPSTSLAVENIRELPRFHAFMRRFGVRPTYFTAYTVASEPWAAATVRDLVAENEGEFAAHLHPWNTPPLRETAALRHTMMKNLPVDLQREKLERLTETITAVADGRPTSFRAGRFGMGPAVVKYLVELGYRADSSVTPYLDWTSCDEGPDYRTAPLSPYRISSSKGLADPSPDGELVEVPVSVGYSREPFYLWDRVHSTLDSRAFRRLRLPGIAGRLGIIKKVILSPENETAADMMVLARRLVEGPGLVHMMLHSSTLSPGLTPFTATAADVERLYAKMESFFEQFAAITPFQSLTVTEVADQLAPDLIPERPPEAEPVG